MNKKKKIILITILVIISLLFITYFFLFFIGKKGRNIGKIRKILNNPEEYIAYYHTEKTATSEKLYEIDDMTRDAVLDILEDVNVHLSYVYILGSGFNLIGGSHHSFIFVSKTTGEKTKVTFEGVELDIDETQYVYCEEGIYDKIEKVVNNSNLAKEGII